MTGCCCTFEDDGEIPIRCPLSNEEWCFVHATLRKRVAALEEALDRIARFDECFVEAYASIKWHERQSHAGVALAEA